MIKVTQALTYRGKFVDYGVSMSTGKFPQFVAELVALEAWDEEEQQWVDWSDVEENGIIAYLVLFGKKEETLNCQQVKAVTGWDGLSFQTLAAMDLSEVGIQFRVEPNTYNEKTSLQVAWIDVYDAIPGKSVRKLDAAELKGIDTQYASMLKQSAAKKAPAKAGKATTLPASPGKVTAKNTKATSKKGPVKQKDQAPPKDTEASDEAEPDKEEEAAGRP